MSLDAPVSARIALPELTLEQAEALLLALELLDHALRSVYAPKLIARDDARAEAEEHAHRTRRRPR